MPQVEKLITNLCSTLSRTLSNGLGCSLNEKNCHQCKRDLLFAFLNEAEKNCNDNNEFSSIEFIRVRKCSSHLKTRRRKKAQLRNKPLNVDPDGTEDDHDAKKTEPQKQGLAQYKYYMLFL